eukprot:6214552-Pleurochrysis_carterae.AAC.1
MMTCAILRERSSLPGSKRQHRISLSSTEAEIVAASHTAAEVIYLRGLLAEMGANKFEVLQCTLTTRTRSSSQKNGDPASALATLIGAT